MQYDNIDLTGQRSNPARSEIDLFRASRLKHESAALWQNAVRLVQPWKYSIEIFVDFLIQATNVGCEVSAAKC